MHPVSPSQKKAESDLTILERMEDDDTVGKPLASIRYRHSMYR